MTKIHYFKLCYAKFNVLCHISVSKRGTAPDEEGEEGVVLLREHVFPQGQGVVLHLSNFGSFFK